MGWALLGIYRYPTSLLTHSAVGIEVLPGLKGTLGRTTWPPHALAISGQVKGQDKCQARKRIAVVVRLL